MSIICIFDALHRLPFCFLQSEYISADHKKKGFFKKCTSYMPAR